MYISMTIREYQKYPWPINFDEEFHRIEVVDRENHHEAENKCPKDDMESLVLESEGLGQ